MKPDVIKAKANLDKAIDRHQRHMDGKEKTSEASQMKLMKEMKSASVALGHKVK